MEQTKMNDFKKIELTFEGKDYNCCYLGNIDLLSQIDFAFLCPSKCPGNIIIKARELAFEWLKKELTVAGGFHSPVERQVVNVLMKGSQPIVICLAVPLENMSVPETWKKGILEERILVITPIRKTDAQRPTQELCDIRDKFVTKLAAKIYIPYVDEHATIAELYKRLKQEGKLIFSEI